MGRLTAKQDAYGQAMYDGFHGKGGFETVERDDGLVGVYGNNFGLFGSFKRARWLLRRLHKMTRPGARIIAESRDPYDITLPCHLAYHRRNRRRGRMAGQLRIRVRYLTHATPYFDYLLASKDEMRHMVAGTGWKISRFFDSPGSGYVAVIEKE